MSDLPDPPGICDPTGTLQCNLCGKSDLKTAGGLKRHVGSAVCLRGQLRPLLFPPNQQDDSTQEDLAIRLQRLRQSNTLLKRIPKAARHCIAEAFLKVVETCIVNNDLESWTAILIFPYLALSLLSKKTDRKTSLTAITKQNLPRKDVFSLPTSYREKQPGKSTDDHLAKAVSQKIQDGDISGAVRLLSSDDAFAPPSIETLSVLKEKHPSMPDSAEYPTPPHSCSTTNQAVTSEEMSCSIISFPNGSAGGIDGLRPQHLKDMVSVSTGLVSSRLIDALCRLTSIMLDGKVPAEVCPIVYGANLTALVKKDGGIRLIAVGSTLRRLSGKIVNQRVMTAIGDIFRPCQLGYGARAVPKRLSILPADSLAGETPTATS